MKTITTPNFTGRIAKIIEEVSARTCIDAIDTEVLKEILQDSLNECCTLLNGYYEEEYYNAISSARSSAYDDGHSDGHSDGYDDGHSDGYDEGHSEGYTLGYSDGHSKSHSAV